MKQKHASHSQTRPVTHRGATWFAPVKNFILATMVVALSLFPAMALAAPPPPKQKKETAAIDVKAITAVSFDISKESANHWTRRVKLTFNNSAQTETLQDFPVLVTLNATRINYNDVQDQGQDLRFVDADGTTLPYEIEQWNESGTSYVWVKIPQITGSSATDYVWLYYGNAAAAATQNAPAVWSNNYRMVYHLHENPALQAGAVHESTDNAFHASNQNSTDAGGYIANGQAFNGIDQYIDLGSNLPVLNNVGTATLSAWAWSDSDDGDVIAISRNNGGSPTGNSRASITQDSNHLRIHARTLDDDSDYNSTATDVSNFTPGAWHYVVAVIDYANDDLHFYIDGVAQVWTDSLNFTATSTANTNSTNGALGSNDDGNSAYFDGTLDEIRVAASDRSGDWVAAQYLSMNDAFITYTAAESLNIKLGDDIIGAPLTYALTITNTGNSAATNLIVSDTLPSGANYISGGTYLPAAQAVEWAIGNIGPSNDFEQVSFTISTCQASLLNAAYRVVTSTQAVASGLGPQLITILQPPTLSSAFTYTPASPTIAATVTFTGSHTTDGGVINAWHWDFGDSSSANGKIAQHSYASQGNYNARLTITDTCGYTATITHPITVSGNLAPIAINDQTTVLEGGTVITLTGNYTSVLHNDSDPNADPLSISTTPLSGPTYGALTLYSNGTFSYTHDGSENHSDSFTYTVHDGILSDTAIVDITIDARNDAPNINPTGNPSVDENNALAFTATASDADLPADTLTFSLEPGAPTGTNISSGGNFSWTPTEAQGPGVYSVTLRVNDDGSPLLSDTHILTITVNEVNQAPNINPTGNPSVDENNALAFTATAGDTDLPANTLSFSLEPGAPTGANISSGGNFSWTPTEAQGPGVYNVTLRVSDDGSPLLSDTHILTITINEVNLAPNINPTGNPSVDENNALAFTATANDTDLPANTLSFSLEPDAPTGTNISSGGNFSWTPTEAQGPGVYSVTLRVSDDGSPPLSDTHALTITVNEVNQTPSLTTITDKIAYTDALLTFSVSVSDADLPTNIISFTLEPGAPTGASISNGGVFSWTPTLAQTPGVYPISVRASDDGSPPLSDVKTFTVTVSNSNGAPLANDDVTLTNEDTSVTISVLDNDSDPQMDPLTVTLATPATSGQTSNDGSSFTYTPTLNFYGTDTFTYIVSDGILTDTARVSITVNAINDPPTISDIPNRSTNIDTPLGPLTFTIGDVETPATALTLLITSSDPILIPQPNINTSGSGITRTLTLTPALGTLGSATISVTVDDGTDQTLDTFNVQVQIPHIYHLYLPLIMKEGPASDLIVETIIASSNDIQVVIKNIGSAPVADKAFWVDVYINPITVPTTVNQTWNHMGDQGMVWSVLMDALPLESGESLTLTITDPYYWGSLSNVTWPLPAGSWIYAQVDSADTATNYGAILEDHEIINGDYNNISVIQSLAAQSNAITARTQATRSVELEAAPDLPPRP